MNSGKWSKIEVPSQWELQGFGEYTYGRFYLNKGAKPSDETGLYRYQFKVPAKWKDMQVSIVFEGVMTDTEVKINDISAGDIHQGGFYRFSYDITDKLNFGKKNNLECKGYGKNLPINSVSCRTTCRLVALWRYLSAVYLKAMPKTHIERIAVNAMANGKLVTELHLKNISQDYSVAATITPVDSKTSIGRQIISLNSDDIQTITTEWKGIQNMGL